MSAARSHVPRTRSPDSVGPKPDIGGWLGTAFEKFGEEWLTYSLQGLVCLAVIAIPTAIGYVGMFTSMVLHADRAQAGGPPPAPPTELFLWMGVMYGGLFLGSMVSTVLLGGVTHTAGKQLQGRAVAFGDLFGALDRAPAILGLWLIAMILSAATCGIGMVFVGPLLIHVLPLLTVERVGLAEALSRSSRAATRQYWWYLLWTLLLYLVASVGQMACLVGYAATLPIATIASVVAYRAVFLTPTVDERRAEEVFGD